MSANSLTFEFGNMSPLQNEKYWWELSYRFRISCCEIVFLKQCASRFYFAGMALQKITDVMCFWVLVGT